MVSALGLATANAEQRDPEALEEVTVVGAYLRTSQGDMPSPIKVLEREEFANQGISTPAEFIGTLTINTGAENSADNFTGGGTFGTSNVNLRGLGIGANLVLLNGRRQTQSAIANGNGETFVDIASLVPMIALERIEVLKDGASSLYGSDAISGVVNFVTRSGFYRRVQLRHGANRQDRGRRAAQCQYDWRLGAAFQGKRGYRLAK